VPDVLNTIPANVVEVKYPSGAVVKLGNELTPTQVKDIPSTIKWTTVENGLYTICMTDPDAPCREKPTYREWHHWLVVNIPQNDVSNGDVLSEYIGASPSKGTGLHRYVIVVYKQPNKLTTDEKKIEE